MIRWANVALAAVATVIVFGVSLVADPLFDYRSHLVNVAVTFFACLLIATIIDVVITRRRAK